MNELIEVTTNGLTIYFIVNMVLLVILLPFVLYFLFKVFKSVLKDL